MLCRAVFCTSNVGSLVQICTVYVPDQSILAIVREYERNGCDMNQYKPYLWGTRAVEHHALKQDLRVALKKQPTMAQVLEGIDPDVMLYSIHHFPLTRSYEVGKSLLCSYYFS